jgi:hypothetical protein
MNNENRQCQNCQQQFVIESDDFGFYEKMQVPAPTFCSECRLIRRLSWRNERVLYKAICVLCNKNTFSLYASDSPFTVYCRECWVSDNWNPMEYGREYDFNRPFFEQYDQLLKTVPVRALFVSTSALINSDYTNLVSNLKNCYLIFNSDYNENCSYGTEIQSSKNCYDNTMIDTCEFSYGNFNCQKCYQTFYSVDCEGSNNIWFSRNLSGCSNCFGCVNLRKKQYHIFNEPYSKEEYEAKISGFKINTYEGMLTAQRKANELAMQMPHKFMHERQNQNVSGEYIYNCKDVHKSFIMTDAQNCKYSMWSLVKPAKDCWDYTEYGDNAELVYDSVTCAINVSRIKFSNRILRNCSDVEYSFDCFTVQNIFGCSSVRNQQYVILNKKYSKEEYEALLPKIKKHMSNQPYVDTKEREYKYGDFYPTQLSPWSYNETSAQEFFPLSQDATAEKGYRWKESEDKTHKPSRIWNELPSDIYGVDDSILNETILCQAWDENEHSAQEHNCSKAFRLTQQELNFYKQMGIPLPRQCWNTRQYYRTQLRNPLKLWTRKCQCTGSEPLSAHLLDGSGPTAQYKNKGLPHKPHADNELCPSEFETAYSTDRSEIVYCKECYNGEFI